MPKTFEQLTNLEKKRLGQLYRNLQHFGFRKAFISIHDYTFIYNLFELKFTLRENGCLCPSEYIQLMQAIYDIYGWGIYDDEDELTWLWNKIKSEDFIIMLRRTYGNITTYLQLATLINLYKKDFKLRIHLDEL